MHEIHENLNPTEITNHTVVGFLRYVIPQISRMGLIHEIKSSEKYFAKMLEY